jgi:hypothetical protein
MVVIDCLDMAVDKSVGLGSGESQDLKYKKEFWDLAIIERDLLLKLSPSLVFGL